MMEDLIVKNRSYRRFFEDHTIDMETLRGFIDLARLSASAANKQPLKYILSCDSKKNSAIFPHLGWAAYMKDWPGPDKGERPSAYVIILLDTGVSKSPWCDHGIAAQSILLGAAEKGLGGCMIASIQRNQLREALDIPKKYEILLVIALGRPREEVRIENLDEEGEIEYWRDENDIHHVPKRSLDEIILE
jgi:nitroreductase